MTVAAQPAALPLQLEATLAAATPGAPAADLFGGLVAALAASVVKPIATGETVTATPELPGTAATPAAEADPDAADRLIALGCCLPAQSQFLVRKPGQAVEANVPEHPEADEELGEQPKPCGLDAAAMLPLPNPVTPPPVASAPVPQAVAVALLTGTPAQAPRAKAGQAALVAVELAPAQPDVTAKPAMLAPAQPDVTAKPAMLAPELLKAVPSAAADPVRQALTAVLAQTLPAAIKHEASKTSTPAPLAPELKTLTSFMPTPLLAPELSTRADPLAETTLPTASDTGELIIERHLDMASSDEWLDNLAKDIARSAGDTPLRFRLNPENLGSLRVEIANDRGGTAVRLTADTEAARAIIADAQPRLIAEARAQGLRISEAHVDLGQQPGSDANRRQAENAHEPQLRTARSVQEDGERDGKPTRQNSERYA